MQIGRCNVQLEFNENTLRLINKNCVVFSCVYGDSPQVMPFDEAWTIVGELLRGIEATKENQNY